MSHYIPTIEELKRKSARERDEIFREAWAIARSTIRTSQEREAAQATMKNVLLCHNLPHGPRGPL